VASRAGDSPWQRNGGKGIGRLTAEAGRTQRSLWDSLRLDSRFQVECSFLGRARRSLARRGTESYFLTGGNRGNGESPLCSLRYLL
jgi:hypothetical protein